jgi:hypothetical protein
VSRILFVMLHPGFVRYYEDALVSMAAAGHDVHVAFEISRTKLREDLTAARLAAVSPRLTCGTTPERLESVRDFLARSDRSATRSGEAARGGGRAEAFESLATTVRLLLDYLRFFEPAFAGAASLQARAAKRLPRVYRSMAALAAAAGTPGRAALARVLRVLERLIPVPEAIDEFLRVHRPDLLLVTPLVELGSQQVDYVKSSRRLGIRSVLCVASWDNLTSKGLMRVVPDHVMVWNEAQKTEAVELHGAEPAQVVVTGASLFDRWFDAAPSRSRDEFCAAVGLDPSRPFVLYTGSSIFIAPDEVPFVERWLSTLRESAEPALASAGVLLRPHPANARQWRTFDRAAFANTAIWPPIGTDPNDPDFRRDYFESLFYSAAVVGINTSAQIEASIVGRPVLTIRSPEFAHSQDGTLHFRYLVGAGGPVRAADTLDAHVEQLRDVLRSGGPDSRGTREFVRAFVRPHGLDVAATPLFVDAVATLAAAAPPAPRPEPAWIIAVRPLAAGAARAARLLAEDRPLWVYVLRPVLTAGVRTASVAVRTRTAIAARLQTGVKRLRRLAWRAVYESSRTIRQARRRVDKPIARVGRYVANAARRAIRRGV